MSTYHSNMWTDPMLWTIFAGLVFAWFIGHGFMFVHEQNKGNTAPHKKPKWWVFSAIWTAIFVTYGFGTYLGYRRISYRAAVQDNCSAKSDQWRIISIYIIIILLSIAWTMAATVYYNSLITMIIAALLLLAIAYEAGLISKWGCNKGNDDDYECFCSNCYENDSEEEEDESFCDKFGNGKGSVFMLLPFFVWTFIGGFILTNIGEGGANFKSNMDKFESLGGL